MSVCTCVPGGCVFEERWERECVLRLYVFVSRCDMNCVNMFKWFLFLYIYFIFNFLWIITLRISFLQEWRECDDCPILTDSRITAGDGKVYVMDGKRKEVAVYDPKRDAWTTLANTKRRHEGGSTVYSDSLMVLGGDSEFLERHNEGTNEWSRTNLGKCIGDYPFAFILDLPKEGATVDLQAWNHKKEEIDMW